MFSYPELFVIVAVAITTACVAGMVLANTLRTSANPRHAPPEPVALLFDGGVLHHATQAALGKFAVFPGIHSWQDLRSALVERFPEFPEKIVSGTTGHITMTARDEDNPAGLRIDWRADLCWVELTEAGTATLTTDARLSTVCCSVTSEAAWEIQSTGEIGWRNTACEHLLGRIDDATRSVLTETRKVRAPARIATCETNDAKDWYEITDHLAGDVRLRLARRITETVQAEAAQRQMVQTIAKTFGHLSAGLAIFDGQGKLSIFNPALVDLTGLPPHFLANQPDILSFFDQLRENRSMPEPKSYQTWRQDMARLISAAADGQYSETWSLDDGRTFAVKGRPHQDGAVAFMIEDISAEVSLSRSFRTEMTQYEAVLDASKEALAVFSANGVLTFCNKPYRDLWGQDPESAFADVTIGDAINVWRKGLRRPVAWAEVTNYVTIVGPRKEQELTLLRQGEPDLSCTLVPIMANATLVRFAPIGSTPETVPPERENTA